ncbi:MAG: response regulator [Candidatus Methylomirabilales bacterium]
MTARILVTDDEAGMRRSLAMMLRREGYHVAEAGSVAEALRYLRGERYDLIIADLKMEPLNGIDLLTLARKYHPECPVIIITAFGSPETRSEALRLGAADFLDKPLQATNLFLRIREIITERERGTTHGN